MDNLVVSLRNREQVAENTLAFHLEKPKGFIFKPGQALDVTLTNPGAPDPEGNSRMLSIASPPYADEVIVATRVRDTPFKRFLKNAQPGSLLKISEPSGSFTLTDKGLAQFMKDWVKAKQS